LRLSGFFLGLGFVFQQFLFTHLSVINTSVRGIGNELYPFGIASINSSGNYLADDYIASCKFGLQLSPADKYRSITTTDCPVPISGGNAVDGKSN
jgi:hypothetical protein